MTKHPLNAPGKYYVDCDACIDHAVCAETAPNNFRLDEDWIAYVYKQPDSREEEAQCREALASCPVEAIRDDGDVV